MGSSKQLERYFPRLRRTPYRITSDPTASYNCIAWAAGDDGRWWWPAEDYYWPAGARSESTMEAFVDASQVLGFNPFESADAENGFEKIALARDDQPTHAAAR